MTDPFGTAGHRDRVLAMWTSAPARFREDANAEEELALGAYRDRVVVELAQNAADAAVRAGVPGRLLLRLDGIDGRTALVAANTGAPLDAEGVLALATLRASAKRDGARSSAGLPGGEPLTAGQPDAGQPDAGAMVGRFGVGFSAVLGVTDEPMIVSRNGGVRFSAGDTRDQVFEAARGSPGLADEVARRDGHVPTLRLPFPAEGAPPPEYDTAVVLPLRDTAAEDLVLRLLAEVGDPLLLALPGLAEVTVAVPGRPPRTVTGVESRWHVLRRGGEFDPALLADRPTEERARRTWSVTWAIPREQGSPGDPLPALASDPLLLAGPVPGGGPAYWGGPAHGGGPGYGGATARFGEGVPDAGNDGLGAGNDRLGGGGAAAGLPAVVHAPTPSDEPLPWPALLVATFPLDSSRRHVAPGPVTDALVRHAAAAYAELLTRRASSGAPVWGLVPVGLPAGALDAALRTELYRVLPGTPLLPDPGAPADQPRLWTPREVVALEPPAGADPAVVGVLAPWLGGLVTAPRGVSAVLTALQIRRITLAEAIEQLPAPGEPEGWRRTYDALAGLAEDPLAREALAMLPVPLVDGRVVRGVRGLLLPAGPPQVAEALGALGLRAVHPRAAHPLLERLGAVAVDARAVLELTGVRELVAASAESHADGNPEVLTGAVLSLVEAAVAAGSLGPGELPHLADLWLSDAEGEAVPAGALALPGSVAEQTLDPDEVAVVADTLLKRWGREVLAAVGVLDGLAVLHLDDVPLDPDALETHVADGHALHPDGSDLDPLASPGLVGGACTGGRLDPRDLDGWEDWADAALAALPFEPAETAVVELVAVHDLDLVRERAWPQVLAMLAEDPRLRPAVTAPARILALVSDPQPADATPNVAPPGSGDRRAWRGRVRTATFDVPSYTAWWLVRELAGGRPWADPDAEPGVAALLPPAPPLLAHLDPQLRRALGAVASASDLDVSAVQALVDALADPDADLDTVTALQVWAALAELARTATGAMDVEPPDRVRVLDGAGTRVVPASQAVVVDDPVLLQRTDLGLPVLAAGHDAGVALARLLDLPLAADLAEGIVDETTDPGLPASVPAVARSLVPGSPATWCEHDRLLVDGVEVAWWVEPAEEGTPVIVHACTVEGLAYALAWAGSVWHRRAAVAEVLADSHALPRLVAEEVFGSSGRIGG
jgi:hypothetical protein